MTSAQTRRDTRSDRTRSDFALPRMAPAPSAAGEPVLDEHDLACKRARDINATLGSRSPGQDDHEAARYFLALNFADEQTVQMFLDLWVAHRLDLRVDVLGADRHGIFERADGACLRAVDEDSAGFVTRLNMVMRPVESDGSGFNEQGRIDRVEADQQWEARRQEVQAVRVRREAERQARLSARKSATFVAQDGF